MRIPESHPSAVSRRDLFRRTANGFGLLALSDLLAEISRAEDNKNPFAERVAHFAAKAKRVIFLFMHGGPSHVDTFDYKAELQKRDNQPYPGDKPRIQFAKTGNLLASPFEFKSGGQSGLLVSDLFPMVRELADDLCVVRSVHADNSAHGGAVLQLHTGSDTFVRPSVGAWVTYGLGSDNQNLPGFITLGPTLAHGGMQNWSSAFLPPIFQGTPIGHAGLKIAEATIRNVSRSEPENLQRIQLDMLNRLNQEHFKQHGPDSALEGRIRAHELAFRMQADVPKLFDISSESKESLSLYGIGENDKSDNFGRQCLLARRLVEKGVRFVQCTHSYKWDQHEDLKKGHTRNALEVDRPIAGLLIDLKRRGLLKDTLVWWGGEFGRTPTAQGGRDGRDHNPHAFTMWFAGGGVRAGTAVGATDEFGYYVVDNKVHMHDLHATILHLLGLDHERLTYRHGGRDFRLTDVRGRVVKEIVA